MAAAWNKTAAPAIQDIAFGSNDATFASVAVNNSGNPVLVLVSTSDRAISGVTIGGDAMTKVVESDANTTAVSIWKKTGSSYSTPNIVVSGAAGLKFIGITAGYLTGANSAESGTGALPYGFNAD